MINQEEPWKSYILFDSCYPGIICFYSGGTLTLTAGQDTSVTPWAHEALRRGASGGYRAKLVVCSSQGDTDWDCIPSPAKPEPISVATRLHEHPAPPKATSVPHPEILWNRVWPGGGVPKDHAVLHIWRTVLFCRCLVFRLSSRLRTVLSNSNVPPKPGWEAHVLSKQPEHCSE